MNTPKIHSIQKNQPAQIVAASYLHNGFVYPVIVSHQPQRREVYGVGVAHVVEITGYPPERKKTA